ncbi:MAG: L,D-transpeptidase family protein [Nevskiales bacterium]|nr:L,D-transpeptidase family protein [Nevskiales bacterium]
MFSPKKFGRYACAALSGWVLSAAAATPQPTPEQQFSEAVEQLREGRSGDALSTLESLTRREPHFRLAQLFYGELLSALSGAGDNGLMASAADTDPRLQDLVDEARVRLASEQAVPPAGTVPNAVLQLDDSYTHVVLVDLPRARLYLLQNDHGRLTLLRHHYAAMGRNGARKQVSGDMRTPVGLYHVTRWISDSALPELYGAGALPLDYPNVWDKAQQRTGSGIWLHGVPRDTYSRPPRSSEGCVTMANADIEALRPFVRFGKTPVVLSDEVNWVPAAQIEAQRREFLGVVEAWRAAWSSGDTDAYLDYYDDGFTTEQGMTRAAFAAHKRRVNANKSFIDVQLHDLSLFRYPGATTPLMLAEFTMDYRSSNYSTTTRKQQFWTRKGDGSWKIVREENR